MSRERELLNKAIEMIQIVPLMASIGHVPPDFGSELILEIQELLAQPEQTEQEPVAWITEWVQRYRHNDTPIMDRAVSFTKGDAPAVPNPNYIPLYTAPPKRKSLGLEIADVCGSEDYREGFKDGALYAEKCHGIGGGNE